ncbi:emerin isoform X2 [Cynoglossus semilaevis]|uniref:emerin isoform X2 n=1 Tax=Cynoglossus semilaevis TaxID=244447 RepID=UPI000498166E|nr:emerin isoform X2 [Cynoglossus semilaevis]
MSMLSSKTAQEISELLDEYGIKHGPVVDSTRSLYEKKLKEAMAKDRTPRNRPSSDKTYYREEEDEVTYITYRTPVRSERDYGESASYLSSRSKWPERESEQESGPEYRARNYDDDGSSLSSRPKWSEREYQTPHSSYSRSVPEYRGRDLADEPYMRERQSSYTTNSFLNSTPVKSGQDAPQAPQSSRLVPLWLQIFFFLAVAVFLYLVFSNMESNESPQWID